MLAAADPMTVSAVRQRARIEVLEIRHHDAIADRLVGSGRDREVDRRHGRARTHQQRVAAGTAVDRCFGAAIGDRIVAEPPAMTSAPPPPSIVSLPIRR